ncbi:TRAP transporter substrate-binding protein [Desulfallas thermosapovorans]|nr:TRAP transporter substrate-binding protein [Desulfallas thermosapovorans]
MYGKLKNTVYLLLIIQLIVLLTGGCAKRVTDGEQVSPDQKIVIKFSHVVAENTPKGLAAERFASLVQQRTRGRVEVQVFPNSTLYADGEEMQALQSGAVQIIAPATSKLGDLYPGWQALDLPYAFKNLDEVHRAMDGPVGQKLAKSLDSKGFMVLAYWDNGFKQLTNNVRPITSPGDLKGLSFRVMINSPVLREQFNLFGATPVPMPFNDVYQGIERNLVHGQENTISNLYTKGFYRVQSYMTISDHGYMGYAVMVNKAYWYSLPEDIRRVMEETMAEVTRWERAKAAEMNETYLKQLKDSDNLTITELTPEQKEAWEAAFKPLYASFAGDIGLELINELQKHN